MGIVFIIVIFALSIILFKMLNSQEKPYGYTKVSTISYRPDGQEQVNTTEETGILFVNKKFITIDGERYWYKHQERKKNQVSLYYEGSTLKTVALNLPDNLQRLYYIGNVKSIQSRQR